MLQLNRKAELAAITFKILITISCLSLVNIVWEVLDMKYSMDGYNFLLNVSNAVVVVVYLLAGVFFMIWFYTAYKRSYSESPKTMRYPPVWTVLGFSVPVANLFVPYVLVANLWRRLSLADEVNQTERSSPSYFKIWWLSHLSVFLGIPAIYIAALANMTGEELEITQFVLSGLGYLLICNTARYAIRLVRDIQTLQQ